MTDDFGGHVWRIECEPPLVRLSNSAAVAAKPDPTWIDLHNAISRGVHRIETLEAENRDLRAALADHERRIAELQLAVGANLSLQAVAMASTPDHSRATDAVSRCMGLDSPLDAYGRPAHA